jgi:4-hydroxyphenylpyruvate dioxygenase
LHPDSPVADYLRQHPPGVVDVAFWVEDLERAIAQAQAAGAKVLVESRPLRQGAEAIAWGAIAGWGDLRHTLVQRQSFDGPSATPCLMPWGDDGAIALKPIRSTPQPTAFPRLDHAVLNVAQGDLDAAVRWYQTVLGFVPQQRFSIHTPHSGLHSRVLAHPNGTAQLPINEPTSPDSQIQEFLEVNRGAGIQHIALQVEDAIATITALRQQGASFLSVPQDYYTNLPQRPACPISAADLARIAQQQILVDWPPDNPQALLLQTFTQPIFDQPTFFWEIIERTQYVANQQRKQAAGFGEGNFRALFEAIEREQLRRHQVYAPLGNRPYTNSLNQNDGLFEEGGGERRSPQGGKAPLPPICSPNFRN